MTKSNASIFINLLVKTTPFKLTHAMNEHCDWIRHDSFICKLPRSKKNIVFLHRHEACGHVQEVDKGKGSSWGDHRQGIDRKTCCIVLSNALVDMYVKCGALMNVYGSLRAVENGKKFMMELLGIFGSVHLDMI